MRIKLKSKPKNKEESMWRNSPCSMNYVLQNPSMDNSSRFHIGSIYYRDEVEKAKKIFTDFQKPDLLLAEFRRQIEEASHPKYNTSAKKNQEFTAKQKMKSHSMTSTNATNLYQIPAKNSYTYDRNGFRSNELGDYNAKQIESNVLASKKSFSYGRRVDLGRPLNFYPGPGTYNPRFDRTSLSKKDQYYSDKNEKPKQITMRTCIQFRKRSGNAQEISHGNPHEKQDMDRNPEISYQLP